MCPCSMSPRFFRHIVRESDFCGKLAGRLSLRRRNSLDEWGTSCLLRVERSAWVSATFVRTVLRFVHRHFLSDLV
jgi:hypothetical protein